VHYNLTGVQEEADTEYQITEYTSQSVQL